MHFNNKNSDNTEGEQFFQKYLRCRSGIFRQVSSEGKFNKNVNLELEKSRFVYAVPQRDFKAFIAQVNHRYEDVSIDLKRGC